MTHDIPPELAKAWLRRLAIEWNQVNRGQLDDVLWPPVFQLHGGSTRLGSWTTATRTISISSELIWERPWDEVVDTLKHEIAHQWVSETHSRQDDRPHGTRFQAICERLGISSAASAPPATSPAVSPSKTDRALRRIRKLLALAASDNPHEAESAMAAANSLALRYNLSLESAGYRQDYTTRRVGEGRVALPLHFKLIASLLGEFFFVECLWVPHYDARRDRHERVLELCGTPSNLEIAEHVHATLFAACHRLWDEHRRKDGPQTASSRREFMAGVIMGFREKLREEKNKNDEKGLIWCGDPALKEHFRKIHPHTRNMRGGILRDSDSHKRGVQAGRDLILHGAVGSGPRSPDEKPALALEN